MMMRMTIMILKFIIKSFAVPDKTVGAMGLLFFLGRASESSNYLLRRLQKHQTKNFFRYKK